MIAPWIGVTVAAMAVIVWRRAYWLAALLVLGWLLRMAWAFRSAFVTPASIGDAIAVGIVVLAVAYLVACTVALAIFVAWYFDRQAEIDERRLTARERYDEIYKNGDEPLDYRLYIPTKPKVRGGRKR